MKPNHEHDCENCELISNDDNKDLYVCRRQDGRASWILRYSSVGPYYSSFPEECIYRLSKSDHKIELIERMKKAGIKLEDLPRDSLS
jgi:hypothetical protein